jgi:hypothetical protein
MKRLTLAKKLKREAFNSGKEIEAMKQLMLRRIASVAQQLCY